jgi:hypothetical protein
MPKGLREVYMGESEKFITTTEASGRRVMEIFLCDENDPEAIRRDF